MPQIFSPRIVVCAVVLASATANAATPGVVETFQTGLNGWGSNPSLVTHQTAGGADGPTDGFAKVEDTGLSELLIRVTSSAAPDFTGDFLAAGITQVSFAVNELAIDDGLGIRFGFGFRGNFWVSNGVFDPQANTWDTVTIDLVELNFTQVFSGTFDAALSNVQRIQIRHDINEPSMMPDLAMGDFGVDNITLIPTPGAAVGLTLAGVMMTVRRRRG